MQGIVQVEFGFRGMRLAIFENPRKMHLMRTPPHGDQNIRCLVVASENCSAEEIILHCRGGIAKYEIPSRIEFRKRLPETATGKIRRDRL